MILDDNYIIINYKSEIKVYFNYKSEENNLNEYLKSFYGLEEKFPFYIFLAGITFPDPNYHIIRPNSDVWVIEYVIEGDGYVILDGETHHVSSDMIYFLPQGKQHEYFSDSENPFKKIFMNVSGSLCEQLVLAYGLSEKYFFYGKGVKSVFEKIDSVTHSNLTDFEMQTVLQGLFVEILSKLSVSLIETKYSDEVLTLRNYIDANIEKIIPNSVLAGLIFRSVDYTQKLFLREFGTTPYAYQINRKITIAKNLLTNTNISVNEIGASLGYSDPHYFSNIFKAKTGCSPLKYRKKEQI